MYASATVATYPVACELSYGRIANIVTCLARSCSAYSSPSGTYRKICDDESVVVATKLYLRLPLNPSWISVEFSGILSRPSAGEIDPGSSGVGALVCVAVVCVAVWVLVTGGSTRIVAGTKLFESVVG